MPPVNGQVPLWDDTLWPPVKWGDAPPGVPATTVQPETSYGLNPNVGTSTKFAREDHTHGSPPGAVGGLARADLSAQCDGQATVFTLPANYVPGSLWVWIQGLFQGVAPNAHYEEIAPNQFRVLDDLLEAGVELVVAYVPA